MGMLGVEPGALCMLGKYSTNGASYILNLNVLL